MSDKKKVKEYSNGEVTVVWKPQLCIHSENCVKGLPDVFKPKEKPWIQAENADTEALVEQIKKCPSGALSFYMNGEKEESQKAEAPALKAEVLKAGPLMVHGDISVKLPDGSTEQRKRATAFCRCGASSNKPYCDGSHNKIGFE